jgi:hypothetical protein
VTLVLAILGVLVAAIAFPRQPADALQPVDEAPEVLDAVPVSSGVAG